MANIFWMPIQTRTEMLTTGFRTVLGVKVFGKDLKEIEKVAVDIEKALSDFPNTRSVFAERTTGGYFLDFTPNREAAARYGLRVGDVNDVIETAVGGRTIAMTVEGRERYGVNLRYPRDFREDLDALKRVLVAAPMNSQPASRSEAARHGRHRAPDRRARQVANSRCRRSRSRCWRTSATRPARLRSATRNGQLVGFVFWM